MAAITVKGVPAKKMPKTMNFPKGEPGRASATDGTNAAAQ
jgi:hypothetical protein